MQIELTTQETIALIALLAQRVDSLQKHPDLPRARERASEYQGIISKLAVPTALALSDLLS